MVSYGWLCWLVRQKEVSCVILQLQLELVGFSRVSMARVRLVLGLGLVMFTFGDMVGI